MESTISETEAQEIRDLMRNCGLEAAGGYVTGLAHATGKHVMEIMQTREYRAYSAAWQDYFVGMAWRLPEFSQARRDELHGEAIAARNALFLSVTGRELDDHGLL